MWAMIAEEMNIPWRTAEGFHWQLGEDGIASRAGVVPFSSKISMNSGLEDRQTPPAHEFHGHTSSSDFESGTPIVNQDVVDHPRYPDDHSPPSGSPQSSLPTTHLVHHGTAINAHTSQYRLPSVTEIFGDVLREHRPFTQPYPIQTDAAVLWS